MLIIGAVALIAFGPDQLPKVARKAGQAIRDVQNTSQSFIREMERAADEADHPWTPPSPPTPVTPHPPAEPQHGEPEPHTEPPV
jgi:Sec-independent protein translocase protein TatA